MGDARRAHCRFCGGHRDDVGPISWAGYCSVHGKEVMLENVEEMHAKSGRNYAKRQYGMVRSEFGPRVALALKQAGVFNSELLDATQPTPQTGA